MKLTLSQGSAHAEPRTATAAAHTIRLRAGAGFGTEALDGKRLSPIAWPSGAMEYLPPGTKHTHATHVETDWITLELDTGEWEQAAEHIPGPIGPIQCDRGLVDEHGTAWLVTAYRHAWGAGSSTEEAAELESEIAAAFFRALSGKDGKRAPGTLSPATLRRLAFHIESNLDTNIERLAQEAGLSRFYFTSAFRRASGCTPHQYLLGRRLARARKLLRQTSASVTDIALECGFSSHAHLTATFSRRVGMAPSVYRTHQERPELDFFKRST